jgi:hypothetical protein
VKTEAEKTKAPGHDSQSLQERSTDRERLRSNSA